MEKHELARMTFKEAEQLFSKNPVALIPMGSTEEHGPTSPMGDYRVTEVLSRRVAEATGSIMAPIIPFGVGETFRNFPGAVYLRGETLYALLRDVCERLLDQGLDHLLLICGHHGNVPVVERVARDIRQERGIRVVMIEHFRWFTPKLLKELYGTENVSMGHGTEPMISLAMHLFPEDLRMDLAEKEERNDFQGLKMKGLDQVEFEGVGVNIYFNMDELTPNGVLGDYSIATPEAGKKMLDTFVETAVKFIEKFRLIDTHVQK